MAPTVPPRSIELLNFDLGGLTGPVALAGVRAVALLFLGALAQFIRQGVVVAHKHIVDARLPATVVSEPNDSLVALAAPKFVA